MGGFRKIGFGYALDGRSYPAPVVASAEAIYLPCGMDLMGLGLRAGGGAAVVAKLLSEPRPAGELVVVNGSELPAEVRDDATWPLRAITGPLFVLPRGQASAVSKAGLQAVRVAAGPRTFDITVGLFGRGKLLAWLKESGWPVQEG